MSEISPSEQEARKKAIWDKMSPRRRKWVEKMGYENWDPFQEPLHPIDIRVDKTGRTAKQLLEEFLSTLDFEPGDHYTGAVAELTVTMVHNVERLRPIFDFCAWYKAELDKRNLTL